MRRIDKENFKMFKKCGLMSTYERLTEHTSEELAIMFDEINNGDIVKSERIKRIVNIVILKASDTVIGREKALR